MKKSELKAIADKYNMEIARNPVTQEFTCLFKKTKNLIPELDEIADRIGFPMSDNVEGVRELGIDGIYRYRIYPPKNWFDLWGWTD